MEKHEEIQTILGIALVYTIITSILSFLSRLTIYLTQVGFVNTTKIFLQRNALWLIIVVAIIITLSIYTKKFNGNSCSSILHNRTIRLIAGVLIALEGLINLSSLLPICVISIKSSIEISQQIGIGMNGKLTPLIISNIISVVILLFQILIGIYLVKFFDKKTS